MHICVSFVQAGCTDLVPTPPAPSGSSDLVVLPLRLRRHLPSTSRPAPATGFATALGLLLLAAGPLVTPSQGRQQAAEVSSAAADSSGTYAITPQRRALLNTIRYAEGTWKQGQAGYRTLYGGGRFESMERHPEIVVVKRYTSAAAGAYQFLPTTWSEAASKLQLASFDPESQDQAALYLVDRRGMLEHIDQQGLTREAMAVLAREWASFPNLAGRSAYGQPVKKADELQRFYSSNLQALAAQA
jgi:muramidase (phage lysozyme)